MVAKRSDHPLGLSCTIFLTSAFYPERILARRFQCAASGFETLAVGRQVVIDGACTEMIVAQHVYLLCEVEQVRSTGVSHSVCAECCDVCFLFKFCEMFGGSMITVPNRCLI